MCPWGERPGPRDPGLWTDPPLSVGPTSLSGAVRGEPDAEAGGGAGPWMGPAHPPAPAPPEGPGAAPDSPCPAERLPPRHPADPVGHVQPGPHPVLHPAVFGLHGVSVPPGAPPPSPPRAAAQEGPAVAGGPRTGRGGGADGPEPTAPGCGRPGSRSSGTQGDLGLASGSAPRKAGHRPEPRGDPLARGPAENEVWERPG